MSPVIKIATFYLAAALVVAILGALGGCAVRRATRRGAIACDCPAARLECACAVNGVRNPRGYSRAVRI